MNNSEKISSSGHLPPTDDVVVIGGSLAGLIVGWRSVQQGLRVRILEASDRIGGRLRGHTVDGIRLDGQIDGFTSRDGINNLISELGLDTDYVKARTQVWVQMGDRGYPFPANTLFGIPGAPLSSDVVQVLGWGGAFRAYRDRLQPPLTIGHTSSLGRLVRTRMGKRVHDRLVAPLVRSIYGIDPDELDSDGVLPGLNTALTRTGSLSGAVSEMRTVPRSGIGAVSSMDAGVAAGKSADEGTVPSKRGHFYAGLRGGVHRLTEVLVAKLVEHGAIVQLNSEVTALSQIPDQDHWVSETQTEKFYSRAVVVATPAATATRLLSHIFPEMNILFSNMTQNTSSEPQVPAVMRPRSGEFVTLVFHSSALDVVPPRTTVYVAYDIHKHEDDSTNDTPSAAIRPPNDVTTAPHSEQAMVNELVHLTARWPWLADKVGPHRHVVRLRYKNSSSSLKVIGDDALCRRACRDASILLGVPISVADVTGFARTPRSHEVPWAAIGQKEKVDAVSDLFVAQPTLHVSGWWACGVDISDVIAHANEIAQKITNSPK